MKSQVDKLEKLLNARNFKNPMNLRIFLVWKNGYTYVNNGGLQASHAYFGVFSHLRKERGEILNAFSKLEFLIMELVRMKTMGKKFSHNANLVDLIEKPNISNLLQLLRKWKVITKSQQGKYTKLFGVRNQLAHIFDLNEATYNEKPISRIVGKDNFKEFHLDLQTMWKELVLIYSKEQSKIDYSELITEIENLEK